MKRILVVDDEPNMGKVLRMLLEQDGYQVTVSTSGTAALQRLRQEEGFDLIISDLRMPDIDGMKLLETARGRHLQVPFVLITAYGTIEKAVEAMKRGAADFITKPFQKDAIRHVVRRLIQTEETAAQEQGRRQQSAGRPQIICRSRPMQELLKQLQRVAAVSRAVLITGESGSGKELAARELHRVSGAEGRPFISINCPAVPESLFESELFGYRKGTFTGASTAFDGKLRAADGGTLFLDEIGELPLGVQPKLLRFLEDYSFIPLGSTAPVRVRARVVCATNRNLPAMVEQGLFRGDLYYRINSLECVVPPLRERDEDIEELTEFFLRRLAREAKQEEKIISNQVLSALRAYQWPGNVRELRNVMERAALMCADDTITQKDLPAEVSAAIAFHCPAQKPRGDRQAGSGRGQGRDGVDCSPPSQADRISDAEQEILLQALRTHHWNVTAAARDIGITRSALRYRMGKYHFTAAGQATGSRRG